MITGASAGLGAEYARQLAERGADLVLVARSSGALTELAERLTADFGIAVEVLVADLTDPQQRQAVVDRVSDAERPIDLLVNNAGFGLPLDFADNDIEREATHLALHVEVPMRLTHAALQVMRRRGGRIINVASVAGFIPRATYGACKRWLIDFSRWANPRYPRVSVTAVCPGFTHTDFHARMGLPPGEEGVPGWMWLDARDVVRESLRDAARGRSVSVPSVRYRALVVLTKVLPASLLAGVGERGR